MPKHISKTQKVELRQTVVQDGQYVPDGDWVDISDFVQGWTLDTEIGSLTTVELRLTNDPDFIKINKDGRVALNDSLVIGGADISNHTRSYSIERRPGDPESIVIEYQADAFGLRINGGAPWLSQEEQFAASLPEDPMQFLNNLLYDEAGE